MKFRILFALIALLPIFVGSSASAQTSEALDQYLINQWKAESLQAAGKGHSWATCRTMPANVKYSPSLKACGGRAAVTVTGRLKSFFSVQLRKADGGDRLDPNCADADCSPYKVQKYITTKTSRTGCFGAAGTARVMRVVKYTTVKRHSKDSSPLSYCIPSPRTAIN